jgi:hypothetical protein
MNIWHRPCVSCVPATGDKKALTLANSPLNLGQDAARSRPTAMAGFYPEGRKASPIALCLVTAVPRLDALPPSPAPAPTTAIWDPRALCKVSAHAFVRG